MKLSRFGKRFSAHTGTVQLMEDLGDALTGNGDVLMLGGGNPAHIPEVQSFFRERLQRIVESPREFAHMAGNYDPPRGDPRFLAALAGLFRERFGWNVSPSNIVLTAGSQAGFFLILNMLAGECEDGTRRRILLPLAPEYIGYSDLGLTDPMFSTRRPAIETFPDRTFKYHVDFDALAPDDDTAAICVSRPTNPTGNVLTDIEMEKLERLAQSMEVPLIVDNAYGMPFPNILFTPATLRWNENIILCMSLSKIGLPGARTGIVIASEEITAAIATMNGKLSLAMGSFGPAIALDLIQSGEILSLSENVIRPYYRRKAERAMALCHERLAGLDYHIHKAEGAIFLWLWFRDLPITNDELYERLKRRGVLVLSGSHFFPGLDEDWRHRYECIRVSIAMDDSVVERGIGIIAEEVRHAYGAG